MTVALSGTEVAAKLEQQFTSNIIDSNEGYIMVNNEALYDVISYFKDSPDYDLQLVNHITAVDYLDYFEVVYQITS